jgi:hypothetical protein
MNTYHGSYSPQSLNNIQLFNANETRFNNNLYGDIGGELLNKLSTDSTLFLKKINYSKVSKFHRPVAKIFIGYDHYNTATTK